MNEMFYYWVEMYYTCPNDHPNRANRYYLAEGIDQAKSAALASDLTCDRCPQGTVMDVHSMSIEIRTYPFDDEEHFRKHTPTGAVPQILPLKTH